MVYSHHAAYFHKMMETQNNQNFLSCCQNKSCKYKSWENQFQQNIESQTNKLPRSWVIVKHSVTFIHLFIFVSLKKTPNWQQALTHDIKESRLSTDSDRFISQRHDKAFFCTKDIPTGSKGINHRKLENSYHVATTMDFNN